MKTDEVKNYVLIFKKDDEENIHVPMRRTKSLLRGGARDIVIKDYEKQGYAYLGEFEVPKDRYLAIKLDNAVREYNDICKKRMDYKYKFMHREITLNTYTETMQILESNKWVVLKKIFTLSDRINKEDSYVENEEAVCILATYF